MGAILRLPSWAEEDIRNSERRGVGVELRGEIYVINCSYFPCQIIVFFLVSLYNFYSICKVQKPNIDLDTEILINFTSLKSYDSYEVKRFFYSMIFLMNRPIVFFSFTLKKL